MFPQRISVGTEMGFFETVSNPGKAIKDGWDAVTDSASSAKKLVEETIVKPAVETTKSLVNGAIDTLSSVTNIDFGAITGKLSAVGTVLTNPSKAIVNGVSGLAGGDAATVVKSLSTLALATSPIGLATLTLAQVGANKWESSDKSISFEKVESLEGNKDALEFDSLWDLYDGQSTNVAANTGEASTITAARVGDTDTNVLDFNADIYTDKQERRASRTEQPADRKYTNADGEQVQVGVRNGAIEYRATKNGETVTEASQTAERSVLSHKGETATLDTAAGVLNFTGEQLKVLQQEGRAEVTMNDGRRVIKENGKLRILNAAGAVLQVIEANKINIGGDVEMFSQGTNLDEQANRKGTPAEQADAKATQVLVTTDGEALAMLPDGSRIQLRKDGNALVKLSNGQVVLVEGASGKILTLTDGKFVASETSEDGSVGGMQVKEGAIEFKGGRINLREQMIEWTNQFDQLRTVRVGKQGLLGSRQSVSVETQEQTVTAEQNIVTTKDRQGNTWSTDITKGNVEMPEVAISQEEIRVKHEDGRKDTVIKADNEVQFEEGEGPILRRDGSMKLDEETETDAEGNVRSGSWGASAYNPGSYRGESGRFAGRAFMTAQSAQDNARNIHAKASRGRVTMSDIGDLNKSLSDVTGLINQLAAAGCTDLIPHLQSSCSSIIETLNYAIPRVQQDEVAIATGRNISLVA